ncbi:PepSY-associated TM helix domain-containing protein [Catenovulum adriaticum]|uniref:PepSY domain-containing protein n=1 Tax=Catenovulum adriaticum TaxID=2984846 RepID=A0ABY7APZ8_9ALTE|nr:PepSY-associated TM helix domain-containing protein [Catenovulum sp. TS8]WAJ71630.1 PepSY domain-containing protein [Catenovulum sp. TS8]
MHLVIALFAGVILIGLSITGSLLIYAKDIQTYFQPEYWTVAPQTKPLPLDVLLKKVTSQTGQTATLVTPETNPNKAWQVQLSNKMYISVNPYTGKKLHQYNYYQTFYGYLLGFHRWLLYQNDAGGYPLRNIVSLASVCLMLELLLGFYLWVKPKKRLKRLKVNPKAKRKILFYQLHTVVGVYVFIPLFLVAFSGMAFHWNTIAQGTVEAVTFAKVEPRPEAPTINPQSQVKINEALSNARLALPEASLYRIYLPKAETEPMALRMQMPGETHAYSWVWVDPFTAGVLQVYDGSKANFATQVWNFRYKFHIGDFAGGLVQALWLILALTPLFFVVSGVYLFCLRKQRKQKTT